MQPRSVFLLAFLVHMPPGASSADLNVSAQVPTKKQDLQQRNTALLNHAEEMAKRNEALMTRAEEQASRAEAEARRMDAVLSRWEEQSRKQDAILSKSDGPPGRGPVGQLMTTPWYAYLAVGISLIALLVAAKNYWRKAGVLIRGSFQITSSIDCSDMYVSRVTLENLKDRAITVFGVYLRAGHNNYIELKDLEKDPLLLKAYETTQMIFGPMQEYRANGKRWGFNHVLKDLKIPLRLVISTSEGKYVVPAPISQWSPVHDFFRNHLTLTVHTVRRTFKDLPVGDNIRYIVELHAENEQSQIFLIRKDDIYAFAWFRLTPKSLESAEALRAYLNEQVERGLFPRQRLTVLDVNILRQQGGLDDAVRQRHEVKLFGFFTYHVLGRLATVRAEKTRRIENAKRLKDA
jgi:hypothetical protein